ASVDYWEIAAKLSSDEGSPAPNGVAALLHLRRGARVPLFFRTRFQRVFAIIQAVGWPIWPLLLASVIAVALIAERLLSLRRSRVVPPGVLDKVLVDLRGRGVTGEMIVRVDAHSPRGRVLAAGLRNVSSPREIMKEAIEDAGRAVSHQLERYMTTLK